MCHFNTWGKCLQDIQISFWLFKKFFSHTSDFSPHHCEFTSHSSDFFPLRILNLHLVILFFLGGIPIYIPQFWISLLKKVTDFLISHFSILSCSFQVYIPQFWLCFSELLFTSRIWVFVSKKEFSQNSKKNFWIMRYEHNYNCYFFNSVAEISNQTDI